MKAVVRNEIDLPKHMYAVRSGSISPSTRNLLALFVNGDDAAKYRRTWDAEHTGAIAPAYVDEVELEP